MLCIRRVQTLKGLIVHVFGLAAPTVVDRSHACIRQRVIGGLEIECIRVGAEQKTVVLVGIGHIQIGIEGHTVHANAITGGGDGAGDVGAVGIVTWVEHAADRKGRAVCGLTAGRNGLEAGGFGMTRVEPRIHDADLDPGPGDTRRVRRIGRQPLKAPILPILGGAPAGRIACGALFLIHRPGRGRKHHQQAGANNRRGAATTNVPVHKSSLLIVIRARASIAKSRFKGVTLEQGFMCCRIYAQGVGCFAFLFFKRYPQAPARVGRSGGHQHGLFGCA